MSGRVGASEDVSHQASKDSKSDQANITLKSSSPHSSAHSTNRKTVLSHSPKDYGREGKSKSNNKAVPSVEKTEAQSSSDNTFLFRTIDGRFVNCQFVYDGNQRYLQEVTPFVSHTAPHPLKIPFYGTSDKNTSRLIAEHYNSFIASNTPHAALRMGQLPSAHSQSEVTYPEGHPLSRQAGHSKHAGLPRNPDVSRNYPRWSEQGIRLANFVEDSIYQSLKSNDEALVKEWQQKMSEEAHIRNGEMEESSESKPSTEAKDISNTVSNGTGTLKRKKPPSEGSHDPTTKSKVSKLQHKASKSGQSAESADKKESPNQSDKQIPIITKDGKYSLLDALQDKLKHALLNYGQTEPTTTEALSHQDHFGTLFFSPVVDSTVQTTEATSSTHLDKFEECSTESEDLSSSKEVFQGDDMDGREEDGSEEALDLSKSSGTQSAEATTSIPSSKTFSLERILHPSTKGTKKTPKVNNPFMRTFSDLLDLPPREIRNKDPFKVKRRPYRRRRSSQNQGSSTPPEENGCDLADIENETHSPSFILNSPHMRHQPGLGVGSESTDWPSVAYLMNVYEEWENGKCKNSIDLEKDQSYNAEDESSRGSFSYEQSSAEVKLPKKEKTCIVDTEESVSAVSSSSTESKSEIKEEPNTKPCKKCTTQNKPSSRRHYTKKSRLLEEVERSHCQCQSTPSSPFGDRHLMNPSSIRSLLSSDHGEKQGGEVGPSDRRCRVEGGERSARYGAPGGDGPAHVCAIS